MPRLPLLLPLVAAALALAAPAADAVAPTSRYRAQQRKLCVKKTGGSPDYNAVVDFETVVAGYVVAGCRSDTWRTYYLGYAPVDNFESGTVTRVDVPFNTAYQCRTPWSVFSHVVPGPGPERIVLHASWVKSSCSCTANQHGLCSEQLAVATFDRATSTWSAAVSPLSFLGGSRAADGAENVVPTTAAGRVLRSDGRVALLGREPGWRGEATLLRTVDLAAASFAPDSAWAGNLTARPSFFAVDADQMRSLSMEKSAIVGAVHELLPGGKLGAGRTTGGGQALPGSTFFSVDAHVVEVTPPEWAVAGNSGHATGETATLQRRVWNLTEAGVPAPNDGVLEDLAVRAVALKAILNPSGVVGGVRLWLGGRGTLDGDVYVTARRSMYTVRVPGDGSLNPGGSVTTSRIIRGYYDLGGGVSSVPRADGAGNLAVHCSNKEEPTLVCLSRFVV